MLSGIDISEKNGMINWKKISELDVNFAYLKATEGINLVDQSLEDNLKAAQASGIYLGAYHVFHFNLHAVQQAEFFMEAVESFQNLLPPVVCINGAGIESKPELKSAKAFLGHLSKVLGVKATIYTDAKFWNTYMSEADWACEYPLWLDHPGTNWPAQLWPWAGWTYWQYSYQARIPGIPNFMGMNWFNGSEEELEAMVIQ